MQYRLTKQSFSTIESDWYACEDKITFLEEVLGIYEPIECLLNIEDGCINPSIDKFVDLESHVLFDATGDFILSNPNNIMIYYCFLDEIPVVNETPIYSYGSTIQLTHESITVKKPNHAKYFYISLLRNDYSKITVTLLKCTTKFDIYNKLIDELSIQDISENTVIPNAELITPPTLTAGYGIDSKGVYKVVNTNLTYWNTNADIFYPQSSQKYVYLIAEYTNADSNYKRFDLVNFALYDYNGKVVLTRCFEGRKLVIIPPTYGFRVTLPATKILQLGTDIEQLPNDNKIWKGKTINILGDSVTALGQYTRKLAELSGATINNYGISGTSISRNNPDNAFIDRYTGMSNDCDFVIVFGGINDFSLKVNNIIKGISLGVFENGEDNTTFYGCLHILYKGLKIKYQNKPILIITPMHSEYRNEDLTREYDLNVYQNNGTLVKKTYGDGSVLSDYVDAIKRTAQFYSLPVLDLYSESTIQPLLSDYLNYTSDGLHPNSVGGERIAKIIYNALKNLNY